LLVERRALARFETDWGLFSREEAGQIVCSARDF